MDFREATFFTGTFAEAGEMFSDIEFYRLRASILSGGEDFALEAKTGSDFRVHTQLLLPASMLPSGAASFVGPTVEVSLTESWNDFATKPLVGTVEVDVKQVKVSVQAECVLASDTRGWQRRFLGTISCRLPLIGRSVETQVAAMMKQIRVGEEQAYRRYRLGC